MSGPWGIGGWGLDPYGGGPGSFASTFSNAYANTTNSVLITLKVEPLHDSTIGDGDALNPNTWTIINQANGQVFTILASLLINNFTYEIHTLEKLGNSLQLHKVSSINLRDKDGNLLPTPDDYILDGVISSASLESQSTKATENANRRYIQRDVLNIPSDSIGFGSGTLLITAKGDYQYQEGVDLLRKLIIRRLITTPGEFRHIPEFGIGIHVKEPVRGSGDLVRLRHSIEKQLEQEPEVDTAKVAISLNNSVGLLNITATITLKSTNQKVSIGPILVQPGQGVQL